MGEKLGGCSWQGGLKKKKKKNLPLQVPPKKTCHIPIVVYTYFKYSINVMYCKSLFTVFFLNKVDMNE